MLIMNIFTLFSTCYFGSFEDRRGKMNFIVFKAQFKQFP